MSYDPSPDIRAHLRGLSEYEPLPPSEAELETLGYLLDAEAAADAWDAWLARFPESPPATAPTIAPPGSAAKIAVMEARAARGESLFHPLDVSPVEELLAEIGRAVRTARNGRVVPMGFAADRRGA